MPGAMRREKLLRADLPRKNFRPSLSMWKMVQMFPGKAEMEMRKECRKTEVSTFTFCQEKVSRGDFNSRLHYQLQNE